jgi:hypothetical protein
MFRLQFSFKFLPSRYDTGLDGIPGSDYRSRPCQVQQRTNGREHGSAMMRKRIYLSAMWAVLLASAGCTRNWCEHHGYYPAPPPGYAAQGCVPCCPAPAAGYVAPVSGWNAPAAVPAQTCPPGCVAGR